MTRLKSMHKRPLLSIKNNSRYS
ncbi:hypothetical protein MPL1032_200122 [Mesorhizobium plurifarium]|uniref:Uncharacterized protein n=1 Tax=Mesorhizobium plurifarium TaxID=69974 RepID=A0A0K2VYZ3_MESPL|nr:hypothetical protein MPL1032_200122 [Mesorhizobium plurifarium]